MAAKSEKLIAASIYFVNLSVSAVGSADQRN